ncbi:MAG: hypothetical protein QM698_13465 [Micropepsaceae bacterium]
MKHRIAASTGASSVAGQKRRAAYEAAWQQIRHAKAQQCWLEVIALIESMLSDRLEARYANRLGQSSSGRQLAPGLGRCVMRVLQLQPNDSRDLIEIYDAIRLWSRRRNAALHEMVKALEGRETDWSARTNENKSTAIDGEKLFRKLDVAIRKTNKPQ